MGSVPSASSFGLEALLEILRFGYEVETTARRTVVTAVDILSLALGLKVGRCLKICYRGSSPSIRALKFSE